MSKIKKNKTFIKEMNAFPCDLPVFIYQTNNTLSRAPRIEEGFYNPKSLAVYRMDASKHFENLSPCLLIL